MEGLIQICHILVEIRTSYRSYDFSVVTDNFGVLFFLVEFFFLTVFVFLILYIVDLVCLIGQRCVYKSCQLYLRYNLAKILVIWFCSYSHCFSWCCDIPFCQYAVFFYWLNAPFIRTSKIHLDMLPRMEVTVS